MSRRLALLVLFVIASAPCLAQPAPAPTVPGAGSWDNLPVPGGTAPLAELMGIAGSPPRGRALLDVIRVAYDAPDGVNPQADARRVRLRRYLETLSTLERVRRALPGGQASLRLARARESRRAIEDLARLAGASLDESAQGDRLVPSGDEGPVGERRRWLQRAGIDVDRLVRDLNAGETVTVAPVIDQVPLPLPAEVLTRVIAAPEPLAGSLATAILGDRRAALIYHGLAGMDESTRAYLAAHPSVLEACVDGRRASIMAAYGPSLRVHAGRVDVPGGEAAVPFWEAIAGERVSDPGTFLPRVLDLDRGRLALLYDALDHMDGARRGFALGPVGFAVSTRIERFKQLYAAFEPSLAGWDPEARPFSRVAFDAAQLLLLSRVTEAGRLASPASEGLWRLIFDSPQLPEHPEREVQGLTGGDALTAAALVRLVCVTSFTVRQLRFETWQFGQRAFAGAEPPSWPDLLVALRAYARCRTLLLTVERMGITAPAVYAASARQADRLGAIGDRGRAAVALAQFQGALALVERARYGRVLTTDGAQRLVESLASVPVSDDGEYSGAVAAWISAQLVPALGPPPASRPAGTDGLGDLEYRVLAAVAGVGPRQAEVPVIEWEGLAYRVDPGAAELQHMARVRRKLGGASLDAALAFCREADLLSKGVPALASLPARMAALRAAGEGLAPSGGGEAVGSPAGPDVPGLVDRAIKDLAQISKARDLDRLERIAWPLRRAGDAILASVLASLAYAPHVGDPDGPALLAGDPAGRHDFGLGESSADLRAASPWRVPVESRGGADGWYVKGSLLAMDVGLAPLALRRLADDSMPAPSTLNDNDRQALIEAFVLMNPFDMARADPGAIAAAVTRGRALVHGLPEAPGRLGRVLAAAPAGVWRRQVLPWVIAHEPDRLDEFFSLDDLLRIGEAEATPIPSIDLWGTSAVPVDGCLCRRYPGLDAWEVYAGRKGTALVAARIPDLTLRVAEALADLNLPAQLAPAVLAVATQDLFDQARPAYSDDWASLVAQVGQIPRPRMEDFVAALTVGGPLIPLPRTPDNDARR